MRGAVVLASALLLVSCGPVGPGDVQTEVAEVSAECTDDIRASFPKVERFRRQLQRMGGRLPLGENFIILQDGGKGSCKKKVADNWRKGMQCARHLVTSCMYMMNAALAKEMSDRFRGEMMQTPLLIACGLPPSCGDQGAITDTPQSAGHSAQANMTQVLNSTQVQNGSEGGLCEAATHEAMHWAGMSSNALYGEGEHPPLRNDRVYACGRFCGGRCKFDDPMDDCLRCAGTDDEKLRCGFREVAHNDTQCSAAMQLVCFEPLQRYGCNSCRLIKQERCNGEPLPGDVPAECCQSCAGGQNHWPCDQRPLFQDCTPTWCRVSL